MENPLNGPIIRWLEKYTDRRFEDHNALHEVVSEFQRQQGIALEAQRAELRNMDDKVREGQNEWRATMTDRERNFLTKAEHQGLVSRVDELSKLQSESMGRQQMQSLLLAAIPTAVSVISIIYVITQR